MLFYKCTENVKPKDTVTGMMDKNSKHSLANHISCLLINEAGSSVAAKTLVQLAFVSLKPGGAHTLHISAAR